MLQGRWPEAWPHFEWRLQRRDYRRRFDAPQWAGEPLDGRSDLYSLGAILYLMATGKPCFRGESFATLLYQVVHQPHLPAAKANPSLSPWLAKIIDRLLSKNPDHRYQSAADLLRCLETRDSTSAGKIPTSPARRVRTGIAVATAALLFAGLLWYLGKRDTPATPPPPFSAAVRSRPS